jgi:hypothetical protein
MKVIIMMKVLFVPEGRLTSHSDSFDWSYSDRVVNDVILDGSIGVQKRRILF